MSEDLRLFSKGLHALFNTFSIVLEDTVEGQQALTAVESALRVITETLDPPQETTENMTTTTPPAPAPIVSAFAGAVKRLDAVRTALEALTFSVTEDFNGDAFHIVEAHQRLEFDDLTLDQLVMTLNMCRVVRNGKEARLTVAQRAEIAAYHPDFSAGTTKKAQREKLSEIEKALEDQHGKYASKATLTKVKFDTAVTYGDDWLDKVTNFADAVVNRHIEVADTDGGTYTMTLTDEPLCPAPVEPAPAPVEPVPAPAPVEYMPDVPPAHFKDTATQGGEVEAYIDSQTGERVGVDARGRCWRKPVEPAAAPVKRTALDLFLKR